MKHNPNITCEFTEADWEWWYAKEDREKGRSPKQTVDSVNNNLTDGVDLGVVCDSYKNNNQNNTNNIMGLVYSFIDISEMLGYNKNERILFNMLMNKKIQQEITDKGEVIYHFDKEKDNCGGFIP